MRDLIIIGAGPAGITASVYAARKKMDFAVITDDIGGQAAWSGDVENYTGYQFVTGPELASKFEEHMKKYKVLVKEGEKTVKIEKGDTIRVKTDKANYETKAVIVASGKRSRELGVPGEKKFKNRGLTYCATCDGPLFAGKNVAVIGGGNAGLDAVTQLVRIAKHVYLVESTPRLTGDEIIQEKLKSEKNVTVLTNASVKAITGDKMVSNVNVQIAGGEKTLPVEGIFVEIGLTPNSAFVELLEKNKRGEIKVNSYNETSVPGIFAAGDVTDVPEKQIIIAAGEGAKAALSASKYLNKL